MSSLMNIPDHPLSSFENHPLFWEGHFTQTPLLGLGSFVFKTRTGQPVRRVAGGIDPLDPRPNLALLENKVSQLDNI